MTEIQIDHMPPLDPADPRQLLLLQRLSASADGRPAGAIPRLRPGAPAPMAARQRRMWFLHQLDPQSADYHVPTATRLTGPIDQAALARALDTVLARHEALRTAFVSDAAGEVGQVVDPTGRAGPIVEDLSGEADPESALRERLAGAVREPFDPSTGDTFRVTLFRLGSRLHVLLINAHHLVFDGWSARVLQRELAAAYAAALCGDQPTLPALTLRYRDFAAWDAARLDSDRAVRSLGYWRDRLAGLTPLPLPRDDRSGAGQAGELVFGLGADLTPALRALARAHRTSLQTVLLAAWHAVLARLGGGRDVAVGVPVSGREAPGSEDLVGLFGTTVVIRACVDRQQEFTALLESVRERTVEAYTHSAVPLDVVVAALPAERRSGPTQVYSALFDFEETDGAEWTLPGCTGEPEPVPLIVAKAPLDLYVSADGDRLDGRLTYDGSQISPDAAGRIPAALRGLLEAVAADPRVSLASLAGPETAGPGSSSRADAPPAAGGGDRYPAVAAVLADMLGLDDIGPDEDFFELGGHSLLAVKVIERIQRELGARISLRTFFDDPTAAGVAGALGGRQSGPAPEVRGGAPAETVRAPLSSAQHRLWLLDQTRGEAADTTVPIAQRLHGPLDEDALRGALADLVARHRVLGSRVTMGDDGPVQVSGPVVEVPVIRHDLRGREGVEEQAAALVAAEWRRPVDLAAGPALRVTLIRLADTDHILFVVIHHVAFDGGSWDVFHRDLGELYRARIHGDRADLPELPIQYADYAQAERAHAQGPDTGAGLRYWRERLAGLAPLDLPTDRPRPRHASGRGAARTFTVDAQQTAALRRLGGQHGATLFMTLMTAFQALLHRYTGSTDVAVGCPVAQRSWPHTEDLIGCFFTSQVIRSDLSGRPSFAEALGRVRDNVLDALEHGDVPLHRLSEDGGPDGDALFQVLFTFERPGLAGTDLAGLRTEPYPLETRTTKCDLILSVDDSGAELSGYVEYSTDLFDPDTVDRMIGHWRTLLAAAADAPGAAIAELPMLTPDERAHWSGLAGPDRALPAGATLHGLVEQQAARTPDAVAVVCDDERITFADLDRRANQLAHHLRGRGVGPDVTVSVIAERSPELMVGLLGALKAGGAYVPIDPAYPVDRLQYLIENSRSRVILTQDRFLDRAPADTGADVLSLDGDAHRWADEPVHRPDVPVHPNNLAFVVYTSGTTGRPKGVQVDHVGAVNYLTWAADNYPGGGDLGTVVHSAVSFDLTMPALFQPLVTGAGLRLIREAESLDKLVEALTGTETFGFVRLTPSHLRYLAERFAGTGERLSCRGWVVGGEVFDPGVAAAWLRIQPDARMINHYAPSETVVGRVIWPVPADFGAGNRGAVPLGRPIQNTRLHVLDRSGELVPTGVIGELHLGGIGITRGYLRRPGLTADRFVPDPFGDGGRLYRSGDLVRWRADGLLEFIGRIDHQVKVRGHRIELAEIELRLSEHPAVDQAVVVVRDDTPGDPRIVAYTTGGEPAPTTSELRRFCRLTLPDYMVPSHFVTLDELPHSPNGKVLRDALPAPEPGRPELDTGYRAPSTPAESLLAGLFGDVLGVPATGVDDDFFDLGGSSVAVMRLSTLCRRDGLPVTPQMIFEFPTVRALADRLTETRGWQADGSADLDAIFRAGDTDGTRTLVALKPRGGLPPLFCVHPSGGSVGWYVPLAHALPAGRPLYAFQPPGMDGRTEPVADLTELAALYVAEMREVQPSGPYAVAGWSLGGTIAFEMAAQLRRAGEQVDLLLIEATLPQNPRTLQNLQPDIEAYRRGAGLIDELARPGLCDREREQLTAELSAVLTAAGFSRAEIALGESMPMRACGLMLEGYADYRPGSSPGGAALIVTAECRDADPEHPSGISHDSFSDYRRGWERLLGTDLPPTVVAGTHMTMLARRYAGDLANACEEALARLEATRQDRTEDASA